MNNIPENPNQEVPHEYDQFDERMTNVLLEKISGLEHRINQDMTPSKAVALFHEIISVVNVEFEVGNRVQKDLAYAIFLSFKNRMFQLGTRPYQESPGNDNSQFMRIFTQLKAYENFVSYGREVGQTSK